jgi:hypothetical protein
VARPGFRVSGSGVRDLGLEVYTYNICDNIMYVRILHVPPKDNDSIGGSLDLEDLCRVAGYTVDISVSRNGTAKPLVLAHERLSVVGLEFNHLLEGLGFRV